MFYLRSARANLINFSKYYFLVIKTVLKFVYIFKCRILFVYSLILCLKLAVLALQALFYSLSQSTLTTMWFVYYYYLLLIMVVLLLLLVLLKRHSPIDPVIVVLIGLLQELQQNDKQWVHLEVKKDISRKCLSFLKLYNIFAF